MTEIHARSSTSKTDDTEEDGCSSSKKLASDKKIQDKKKEKLMKEKKRILKRLWRVAIQKLINIQLWFKRKTNYHKRKIQDLYTIQKYILSTIKKNSVSSLLF